MRPLNFHPEVHGRNTADFYPVRYLGENSQVKVLLEGREEIPMSFGLGRCKCPARFVAEGTFTIDIATLLWAMRFERSQGVKVNLDERTIVNGSVTAYVVFACLLPL